MLDLLPDVFPYDLIVSVLIAFVLCAPLFFIYNPKRR